MSGHTELRAIGLTERQVSHWCEKGYIRPRNDRPGSGRSLDIPEKEMLIAAVMLELNKAGFQTADASRLARRPAKAVKELRRLADLVEEKLLGPS